MVGNPFDFNRDGRWSMPERAFTHYGIHRALSDADERGGGGGRGGCGCALLLLAVLVALFVVVLAAGSAPD